MKTRLFAVIMTLFLTATAMSAQTTTSSTQKQETQERVFQQIYRKAAKIANDPKEAMSTRKLAIFRADAVEYLSQKTLSVISDTTNNLSNEDIISLNNRLDSMAYFMYEYQDLFVKEYSRAFSNKQKNRVVKLFRDVSINTPLYNDPDRELVLAYYNREDFLTQFSLDTDWVKAVAKVKERLKEL